MKSRGKEICGAEPFRDRAVKCADALDAHASFEFYDERTMRCFPWRASKWEDDAGGSLSAPEAFGRERRQCRGFFFRVLRKKFAAVFSFFWHGNNAIRMKAMAISEIFIKN